MAARPAGRFTVYADRTLQTAAMIERIIQQFSPPPERTDICSDGHCVVTHRR